MPADSAVSRFATRGGFAQLAGHKEEVNTWRAQRGTVPSQNLSNPGPKVV